MKKYIVTILATVLFTTPAICDSANGTIDVSTEIGLKALRDATENTNAASAIKYFDEYCFSKLGDNKAIKTDIKSKGYQQVNQVINGNRVTTVYANKNGNPNLALLSDVEGVLGNAAQPDMCMIFMSVDESAVNLTQDFVAQASNDNYKKIDGIPNALAGWEYTDGEDKINITVSAPQETIELGKMQAILGGRD